MFDYWTDHPPTHELVAAYLGIRPRNRMTAEQIMTEAPEGCLSVNELRKMIAANPLPA